MAKLTRKRLTEMYEAMVTIRGFEERAYELFQLDRVMGAIHLSVGQEAAAVGAISCLEPTDYVLTTHRGHGHCIMKGATLDRMFAELLGRSTGYCKGKGGSMHIADFDLGICGANGIVGGGLPISVGVGLASILQQDRAVALCIFGDGACNQGSFHEALNLASIWKVPVVYLCENNQYAVSTKVDDSLPVPSVADRAAAYGIEGVVVDGNDVEAVHKVTSRAVAKARAGGGPTLIEEQTYRVLGHYAGDACLYRPEGESEWWQGHNDPISRLEAKLGDRLPAAEIKARVEQNIEQAVEAAESAPLPTLDQVTTDVYTDSAVEDTEPSDRGTRELAYRDALNEGLAQALEEDPQVFLVGEDIGRHGGGFQVTKGLFDRFGPERIRDTPISEAAIVGTATGAATRGLKPIAEMMYSDFSTIAMDQICNQAAKMRYMFGGKISVPMVLRLPTGSGGRGNAAQHSQSLEAWFMHVPGLKIAIPATPFDAKGLLRGALLDPNPVLFFEHKVLYNDMGCVPEEPYTIPLGKADIKRAGTDVTVVAYSRMALRALEAAEAVAAEGISAEVVDPRSLVPLDTETIVASVKKTGRVVIVEEACRTCGVGAELFAQITEHAFDYLDHEPVRVAGLDVPIPYSKPLEHASVPSVDDIVEALRRVT